MARKTSKSAQKLTADELRWTCDPKLFARIREQNADHASSIGQSRALTALRLGLDIDAPGYNVFVCGPSGTGKMSSVRSMISEGVKLRRPLIDCLYVQNTTDPDRPVLLTMPAGQGRKFKKEIELFAQKATELVRSTLESTTVDNKRNEFISGADVLEKDLLKELAEECDRKHFSLTQVQVEEMSHLDILPMFRRKPVEMEEFCERIENGQIRNRSIKDVRETHAQLKERLHQVLVKLRAESRSVQDNVHELESSAVQEALKDPIAALNAQFPYEGVSEWLEQISGWITEHLDVIDDDDPQQGEEAQRPALKTLLRVNVLLDNSRSSSAPVIFENSPTFTNLFGTVERPSDEMRPTVDFADIKAGSLLRAHGGYLIINANDAAAESGVWRTLTRVLKARELEIQSPEQFFNPGSGSALKPRPIKVDVKVIAVGDDELYRALYNGSDDFHRVFKVKVDFDDVMPLDDDNVAIYARHAWHVQKEEDLLPITDQALASLCEYGVRLAQRQDWLSTRFSELTDVLREANHYAKTENSPQTDRKHVEKALTEKRSRHSLTEERLRHLINAGLVTLKTEGSDIGTANGLTVVDLGDHAFGQPCRISATTAPGHDGVLSVEREVSLSGRIHDKGTMLLTAYLRAHYLPKEPLALSATIAFEQLHDEVDGDSASLAQAIALLSNLAQIPISQSIAMTGALDQHGHVQAVGGLNEKIEGFFYICQARELTGKQGIILPDDNRLDLVLDEAVIEAVRKGQFHLWTVRHIDEAIEILTGETAGQRQKDGNFPKGTFNAAVEARLRELSQISGPHPTR